MIFSTLTINPAALHLDAEYCKGTPFGECILSNVFTLGLLFGLSASDTTLGTTLGILGMEDVKISKPALHGNTVNAVTTIVAKRQSESRPDSGLVTIEDRAFNQRSEEVASCRRVALVVKKAVA